MVLYKRFVDDENQAVEVPDGKSIKVVAEELKEIADSIMFNIDLRAVNIYYHRYNLLAFICFRFSDKKSKIDSK